MPTKLSVLCDRIIEAGWLVALIVTPLFFNISSSRIFEPDKISVLRSIALLMGLAWTVKGLEAWRTGVRKQNPDAVSGRRISWQGWWSRLTADPLPVLAFLLFVAFSLSTATSVAPRLSLWGSYERLQGLYTTSAYFVMFFSIVALLRTREQVDRLLTTVLVVSLPVSLYGIIQHFGTDPVPWGKDVTQRVASTMGNPIFVAAFLIMTVPLTLYRLLEAERVIAANENAGLKLVLVIGSLFSLSLHIAAWWLGPMAGSLAALTVVGIWTAEAAILGKPLLPFVRVSAYSVLLSTQLTCILLSQSRGPWLGLLAGLFCFALLWTVARRAWRWTTAMAGCSMVVVLALGVMNLPNSPLSSVRDLPYARRLSRVFESGTSRVRILIWQGAEQLVAANPLRAVIGYGPETMLLAYPPYYPTQLGHVESRRALPDRSHNETFDTLVMTGFLGLSLTLVLFTGLVYRGLQYLGLVDTSRQCRTFLTLWCLSGIGAVVLPVVIDHSWRFVGITLPLGLLTGLFAYLSGYGLTRYVAGATPRNNTRLLSLQLFVASVLAALVAHVVEIQVGIAVAATRHVFWVCAALLVVAWQVFQGGSESDAGVAGPLATMSTPPASADTRPRSRRRRRGNRPSPTPQANDRRPAPRRWLVTASLLVSTILMTMVYDFLSVRIKPAQLPSILWLFGFTWAFGGLITLTETWAATEARRTLYRRLKDGAAYVGVTLLVTLLFAIVYQGPWRLWSNPVNIPVLYYTALGLLLLATSGALLLDGRLPARVLTGVGGLAAAVLAVVVVILSVTTNLDLIRADIYFKQAKVRFHDKGKYDQAIALYRRALALEPRRDYYYIFLGKAFLQKAQKTKPVREREALHRKAEQSLRQARALNPLHPDHAANLARLYRHWAQHVPKGPQRTARFQKALSWYDRATDRSPNNVLLWNEWGQTYALMGDNVKARETYQHALRLDATFALTYLRLGALYRAEGNLQKAAQAYEQAVARQPNSIEGHSALGFIYSKTGRVPEAIRENHRVLELAPDNLATHRNLAILYQNTRQMPQALAHAQRALELASPQERPALQKLVSRLRQQQVSPGR